MERFNIYYRKDGRWEGRISRGKRKNGRRKFQYIFGKSKEQVRKKIKEIRLNESRTECNLTVEVLSDEWLASSKYRVKESTLSNYKLKANKHIMPAFGSKYISDNFSGMHVSYYEDNSTGQLCTASVFMGSDSIYVDWYQYDGNSVSVMQKADPKTKDLLNAAETISSFDLSRRKFYKMMSEKSDKSFVVMYGSRKLIIRTEFEKYLLDHPELRRCR